VESLSPYNERSRLLSPLEAKARFEGVDDKLWRRLERIFPVRITRSWANRVRSVSGPLGRQVFPVAEELMADPFDVADPVGEEGRMPVPWVVQKHKDRALLLVTRRCHLHCRYCFRRDLDGDPEPSASELEKAVAYLKASGVREVILSGGDPLVLTTPRLASIIDALRPHIPLIRIHSRAPITFPERVDAELVAMLASRGPLWLVVHCNHPDELSEEVSKGLALLVDGGIPLLNQSVLLKGVNDDVEVLTGLSDALLMRRVKPYYLHHPDAVPGGGAFRVTIEEGLALHDALRSRVSGLGLPTYVIDPPQGTGKIPVLQWASKTVTSAQ
jgi:lysine 2,3-aminomutase